MPILKPLLPSLSISPLHFRIIMTVNLAIGQATPPVGVSLFVAGGISKVSLERISRAVWPFVLAEIASLLTISYIAPLSQWLPAVVK